MKLNQRESKLERNLEIFQEDKQTLERKIGFLQNVNIIYLIDNYF